MLFFFSFRKCHSSIYGADGALLLITKIISCFHKYYCNWVVLVYYSAIVVNCFGIEFHLVFESIFLFIDCFDIFMDLNI